MGLKNPFWTTLPGILTAVAALLTAIATLVAAVFQSGLVPGFSGDGSPSPTAEKEGVGIAGAAARPPEDAPPRRLRSRAQELDTRAAEALLVREDFHESTLNLAGRGATNAFRSRAIGDAVAVVDDAFGLMWERGGAGPMPFVHAQARIDRLNAERFLGYADWRLPTVEEAMSLVEPQPAKDGYSFSPHFDRRANYIWTADRAPDDRAWLVRYHGAELVAERIDFNAMVRAVRSLGE